MTESYHLDSCARRRNLTRAVPGYDQSAVLQREVAARLLERVGWLKINPGRVLDLGSRSGRSSAELARLFPRARIVSLDLPSMLTAQTAHGAPLGEYDRVAGQLPHLPFRPGAFDLVFSNLELPWTDQLLATLEAVRQLLSPVGVIMFTTLGPDTLVELRFSWQHADEIEHVHGFVDMHDIGDAVLRAGFADPVMDTERLTLTYARIEDLLRDLRGSGAQNALRSRRRTLTGAGRYQLMREHYDTLRNADGLLPATVEVIYGHAWGPPPGMPQRSGQGEIAAFPVDQIGRKSPQGR